MRVEKDNHRVSKRGDRGKSFTRRAFESERKLEREGDKTVCIPAYSVLL